MHFPFQRSVPVLSCWRCWPRRVAFAAEIFVAGSDPQGVRPEPRHGGQAAEDDPEGGLARHGRRHGSHSCRDVSRDGDPRPFRRRGAPIAYMPYNHEKVVIDGADPIANWTNYRGSIYQAPMNWSVNQGDGDQVFVDGQMMNYARYPNSSLDVSNPTKIMADTITNASGAPAGVGL